MLQTFSDCYRERVQQGRESAAQFWLGVVADESRSLVREHRATLGTAFEERTRFMDQLLSAVAKRPVRSVALLLLWVVVLDLLFQKIPSRDSIAGSWLFFWLAATLLYGAVLWLVARVAWSLSRPAGSSPGQRPWQSSWRNSWRSSWWRLGLVLGGILGLYMVALTLVNALYPLLQLQQDLGQTLHFLALYAAPGQVWALSLPLLAGTVGALGAATSGKLRTGIAAGALAGGIMLVTQTALVGLLLLLSHAVYHPAPSSFSLIFSGRLPLPSVQPVVPSFPDLPSVLDAVISGATQANLPFGVLFQWLFAVIVWPVPLIVGSVLGARAVGPVDAARGADARYAPEAVAAAPSSQGARRSVHAMDFILLALLLLGLGPALWACFTYGHSGYWLIGSILAQLAYTTTTYLIVWGLIWGLAVVAISVAMYVTLRPRARRAREAIG
jgi:hypothetical protein